MKPASKPLISAIVVGLLVGIIASLICEPHVYRVTSGYSHRSFFVTLPIEPSEEQLLDAVIYGEPLIQDKAGLTQEWRRAEAEGNRLRIKVDSSSFILISPYAPDSDPDLVFPTGRRVTGIWLTQPSTRTRFPPALVRIAYFIVAFTATLLVVWVLFRRSSPSRPTTSPPPKEPPPPRTEHSHAKPDPFTVLGVSRNATFEEIRRAYRTKMREYHPDKVASLGAELRELAERKAKQINEAFETLSRQHSTA